MKIRSGVQSPAYLGNSARAFTLVELLVVITIIAVLGGIVIVFTRSLVERAAIARISSSMRQVNAAFFGYVSEHNGRLPGSTNRGLQPPVSHVYNPQGEYAEGQSGGGGWNDFSTRLGNQLFPYLDTTESNHTPKVISVLSDPRWVKEMKKNRPEVIGGPDQSDKVGVWAVSMAVNPLYRQKDFPELPSDFAPFGKIGEIGGGPSGEPNGVTPCTMALVAARLPLARAWWLTQADLALPSTSNIPENDLNAALRYPLFGSRVTAFLDGSVRVIPVGTDMTKPL